MLLIFVVSIMLTKDFLINILHPKSLTLWKIGLQNQFLLLFPWPTCKENLRQHRCAIQNLIIINHLEWWKEK